MPILTIAGVTLREARRRRLVAAGGLLGILFVLFYGLGLWLIVNQAPCGPRSRPCRTPFEVMQFRTALNMLTIAGLYVANFLTLMTAVLLPVDTISGEIASGVTQTLATKPIRRSEIVIGKWAAYWLLTAAYVALAAGGVLFAAWLVSGFVSGGPGFVPPGVGRALLLILLEATVMLTISIAGGARLSTVTNGIVAFGIFGLGFLGGWVEQIGEFLVQGEAGRTVVRDIGTVVSLIIPADALWRRAAYHLMPPIARDLALTPFSSISPPSGAIVVWAIGYVAVVLAVALRQFERRAL
jgi:ABC-type transport system involved in multi-copper enzyme maturation permease subunit